MEKKAVLITGGTSGIGLAAAKMFLNLGYIVSVLGRDAKKGQKALKLLRRESEDVHFIRADVQKPEDCKNAVQEALQQWGRLDCLVNSAGIYMEESAENLTEESYSAIMDTNIKGTMFMSKYALPALKKKKGNIVNVSSGQFRLQSLLRVQGRGHALHESIGIGNSVMGRASELCLPGRHYDTFDGKAGRKRAFKEGCS